MPLDVVAESDQVLAHLLEPFLRDQTLRTLQLLPRLHQFFLALKHGQPRMVEVVPQLDALAVEILVVRSEA
jgi:hypothetical protein